MSASEKPGSGPSSGPAGTPLVSIVITVFNQARFLADAIASAQAQTRAPAEVIVVDDGSTDDPGTVVARFPAVRLIRQPNRGLASARNTGWRSAHGRYVVFLDADDRLLPRALEANLGVFARDPDYALVYGGHLLADVDGRPVGSPIATDLGRDAYEGLLRRNAVAMHATVMYRRDRLEETGGFDETLPACEDYDLMLRLARHHRFGFQSEVVAEYRRHGDAMSDDVPFMLSTALGVHRRQRAHVLENPGHRAAFVAGVRGWKEHYAREVLWKLECAIDSRTVRFSNVSAVARVFALAPAALVRVAIVEAGRRLSRRLRSPRPVDFGALRRLEPIGAPAGGEQGVPIDRRYVGEFLARHAADVQGRVLDLGDGSPTTLDQVLPDDRLGAGGFDCIVLPHVLHLAFDLRRAVATLHRALKPGGVLLATVPGVSGLDRDRGEAAWQWSFTAAALERLLSECFGAEAVQVSSRGNVLAATAVLQGVPDRQFEAAELEHVDLDFPVVVTARAVKRAPTA